MVMDTNRKKTKSKNYFDDEIIGIMDNGDIVLKPGVKRQPKRASDFEPKSEESQYWNYWVYYRDKTDKRQGLIEEENDWG